MLSFNEAISALALIEFPVKGRKYTWSNKQDSPLLERLDWFFTSTSWATTYPKTLAHTLTMETSDHVPCIITIETNIPKSNRFRFENYWMEHERFLDVVQHGWSVRVTATDSAKAITAKFKN